MELSEQQKNAGKEIVSWYIRTKDSKVKSDFKLDGCAGTGKTFLLSNIRKIFAEHNVSLDSIAFCSFTGKASYVLMSKLEQYGEVNANDYCGTIHRMIYVPVLSFDQITKKSVIVKWKKVEPCNFGEYNLIVVDEGSMVGRELWSDLKSYNRPILVVGDNNQLPPVDCSNEKRFNTLENPNFILTELHRHALDNPIIALSQYILKNSRLPDSMISENVFKLNWKDPKCKRLYNNIEFGEDMIVLCGMNYTRQQINSNIRKKKNYVCSDPYPGERVVCLKNNHQLHIMNGQLGTILMFFFETKEPNIFRADLQMDNESEILSTLILKNAFGKQDYSECFEILEKRRHYATKGTKRGKQIDLFDFGYAISVHKSQGSEWDRVVLFAERSRYWDNEFYKNWLYTAVTRSKRKLFIIDP